MGLVAYACVYLLSVYVLSADGKRAVEGEVIPTVGHVLAVVIPALFVSKVLFALWTARRPQTLSI